MPFQIKESMTDASGEAHDGRTGIDVVAQFAEEIVVASRKVPAESDFVLLHNKAIIGRIRTTGGWGWAVSSSATNRTLIFPDTKADIAAEAFLETARSNYFADLSRLRGASFTVSQKNAADAITTVDASLVLFSRDVGGKTFRSDVKKVVDLIRSPPTVRM